MRLYSSKNWSNIPWPHTDQGKWLKSYIEPLLKKKPKTLISNVESRLYVLHLDTLFIPITVNDKEYHNSYVSSIYSYLLYAEEEMKRHKRFFLKNLLFPLLTFTKLWFRISKINQLVSVNNLFLSTNLYPTISPLQIEKISKFLKQQFPDHAIVFRSLNEETEPTLIKELKKMGNDFITSRSIYLFKPENYDKLPSKKRWIIQKDRKLLEQEKIQIIHHDQFKVADAKRIQELYELLYLKKYSQFNPAFTEYFFEQSILNETFSLRGILYKKHLVGVIGFFKKKNIMATPIVGYDTTLPESLGLYRLLTVLMIEESLATKTLFHMSAGVGHFKRQRGAFQVLEFMSVQYNHLPLYRRILWRSLALLFNRIGAPILKKYKL